MSSLSEAYRAHPVHLHHITPLDFSLVQELPDSHAWPPHDDSMSMNSLYVEEVPVIDLFDPDAIKLVGYACETWGIFQIMNHGIPTRLLEDVEYECRRLFSLPTQQKLKVLRSPNGTSGYGLPRISSFFSNFMWHEGFTIIGSPIEHARKLWLYDYIQFCDVMVEYEKEMKELSERLMHLMLESLGIAKEDKQWTSLTDEFNTANTALQLNSYPICPDPNRAMGLAAHTDTSLFTILYQSSTSGLQVLRDGVGWVTVPPLPGALIVNVGDLLHILSNARFPSVLHRAVVNQTYHRLSIAYFYGPQTKARISPFSKLVGHNHVPRYRSVTWREYIGIKAKHLDKALSLIQLRTD